MSPGANMAFTFLACADLKRAWETIAMPINPYGAGVAENLASADRFAHGFSRHCELIAANPELGPKRDELREGLRSSVFQSHVIFYRLRGERVEVLRVLRAKRDVEAAV